MNLGEAITKSQKLRDLWKMDVHVLNEEDELDEHFDDDYFCVIDINLYIYVRHEYCKNHKVYYTAQNIYTKTDSIY